MNYCRNFVKVRVFVDGWLSKDVKDENDIGIEEFSKDLMEEMIQSRERHNLIMDILLQNMHKISQVQTLLPFSVSS